MKFGSVCSGIEAASVAFHPFGMSAAWLAEVDVAASTVLSHRLGATRPRFMPDPDEPEISLKEQKARRAALKNIERQEWGDSVVNWGDMTKLPAAVLSGEAEAPDVLCGGTPCFTAGHMVLTISGYKAIENIRPGDMVATHKGRFRSVLRVGSKEADVGQWKAVGQSSGIVCTADHPFYVAADLSRSTRINGKGVWLKSFGSMNWVKAEDSPGSMWSSLRSFDLPLEAVSIPQPHGLTRSETFRLLGWYLGDGWIRTWPSGKKAIVLGLSDAKVNAFRISFPNLNQSAVGSRTVNKISIGCTDLCEWILQTLGSGASDKNIPGWMMSDQDRGYLLDGYIATDGHVKSNGTIVLNSVSETLARGTASLAQTLGYVSSVTKVTGEAFTFIEDRFVNQKPYFSCTLHPQSSSRKSHIEHDLILRKIQSFSPIGRDVVFNIEVDEDNSFILNGAIVHNCQSFSIAGLRGGLADRRGNLTLSFVELADAIDFKRAERGEQPCTILWENVPGVLSDSGNAFGHFLAGLAGEDMPLEPAGKKWTNAGVVLGPKRAIAWIVKDAQYFGLAQRRRRVFVVASSRKGFDPAKVLFEFDGLRRDSAPIREAREEIAGTLDARTTGGHWDDWRNPHPSLTQSHNSGGVGSSNQELFSQRGAYLVPGDGPERSSGVTWAAEVACTLDAQYGAKFGQDNQHINSGAPLFVPAPAYALQASVTRQNPNSGPDGIGVQEDLAYTIEARPEVQLAAYGFQPRIGRNGRGDMGEICNALTAQAGETGKGDAAPCVAVLPFDTTQITSPTNGSNPQWNNACHSLASGAHVPAVCVTGNLTHTLKAEGFDASEDGTGRGQPIVPVYPLNTQVITRNKAMGRGTGFGLGSENDPAYTVSAAHSHGVYADMSVRRLMPVECERLQGFPDQWTLVPVGKGLAADGPRYKQLGNSWAVNCVRWIGSRLVAHLLELDSQTAAENDNNPLHAWMVAA